MKILIKSTVLALLICSCTTSYAADDARQLVKFPEMMQHHMLASMRNHLETLNAIMADLAANKMDAAADIAENQLGMSSLPKHEASHLAKFMPKGMRMAGTNMHKAASLFALKAQEGDLLAAYKSLSNVTSACVACHSAYRIR
jgi:soluble cytochrome b562